MTAEALQGLDSVQIKSIAVDTPTRDVHGRLSGGVRERIFNWIWSGEDYLALLTQSLEFLEGNEAFDRQVRGALDRPIARFNDALCEASSDELDRILGSGPAEHFQIELVHSVRSGFRTVQYDFWRHDGGWLAIGRDRTIQIELVSQLALLVSDLEVRIDLERERSEELKTLSEKDPLTGLANRRQLNRVLDAEIKLLNESSVKFSVISLDVDHFKEVNDQHGHPVGDEVLRRIARALQASLRGHDCVARCGGEEFVVIARGLWGEGATQLGDRLRRTIEKTEMPAPLGPVTVSVGVAWSRPEWIREADPQAGLLRRADEALYEAKRGGRNCVRTA